MGDKVQGRTGLYATQQRQLRTYQPDEHVEEEDDGDLDRQAREVVAVAHMPQGAPATVFRDARDAHELDDGLEADDQGEPVEGVGLCVFMVAVWIGG